MIKKKINKNPGADTGKKPKTPPLVYKNNPLKNQQYIKKKGESDLKLKNMIQEVITFETNEDIIHAILNQFEGMEKTFFKKLVYTFNPEMIRIFLTKYVDKSTDGDIEKFYSSYINNEDIAREMDAYSIIQKQKEDDEYARRENEQQQLDTILNLSIKNNMDVFNISKDYMLEQFEQYGSAINKALNLKIDNMINLLINDVIIVKTNFYETMDHSNINRNADEPSLKLFIFKVARIVNYLTEGEDNLYSFKTVPNPKLLETIMRNEVEDENFFNLFVDDFIEKLKEKKTQHDNNVKKYNKPEPNVENGEKHNKSEPALKNRKKYRYMRKWRSVDRDFLLAEDENTRDKKIEKLDKRISELSENGENSGKITRLMKLKESIVSYNLRKEDKLEQKILKLEESIITDDIKKNIVLMLVAYEPKIKEMIKKIDESGNKKVVDYLRYLSGVMLKYEDFLEYNDIIKDPNVVFDFLTISLYKIQNPTEHFYNIKKYVPFDISLETDIDDAKKKYEKISKDIKKIEKKIKEERVKNDTNNPLVKELLKMLKNRELLETEINYLNLKSDISRKLHQDIEELKYRMETNNINDIDNKIKKLKLKGEDYSELSVELEKESREQALLFSSIERLKEKKKELEQFDSKLRHKKFAQIKNEDKVVEKIAEDLEEIEEDLEEIEEDIDVTQYKNEEISKLQVEMDEKKKNVNEQIAILEMRYLDNDPDNFGKISSEVNELNKQKDQIAKEYGDKIKEIREETDIVILKDTIEKEFKLPKVVKKIEDKINNVLKRKTYSETTQPQYSTEESSSEDESDSDTDDVRCEKCFDRIKDNSLPFLRTFVGNNEVRFCCFDCFDSFSFKKKKKNKKHKRN